MSIGEQRIWEMARAFQASRILLTAAELGIFGALGDEGKSSTQVASEIGTDARATDRLMNALVALGLLNKYGDKYSNLPDTQEYLVPGKPKYAGGAIMHAVNMWESWSTLTDAVKKGTSVLKREGTARADWVRPFITAMHYNATALAPTIVGLIDLEGVSKVLDVGGGSGAYSIEFCRAKPDIEAVVFDLPDVLPITQEFIAEAGMAACVSTTQGDYNLNELGSGFDLVFLSQIIHSNSPDENIELFRKCFRALNPGGRIVLQDFIMDEGRTSPAHSTIFALNMLVGTRAGDTYTESEVRSWFETASFKDPGRINPPGGQTVLLWAKK